MRIRLKVQDDALGNGSGRVSVGQQMITVGELQSTLGLSKSYAYKLTTRLESEGKLCDMGYRYRKLFVKGEGGP
ncbi:hypothetical protein C7120_03495 [Prevotella sp. oral taxon 376]|uniref:hypothetical protein n=1 Tax=Prevotella sp. oral taxon 376 TaxID=712466 RepID=UPI000D1D8D0B|nr:hypothetical protein [Prevotella sp. oral taxon 376]PTL33676.1 hypothetical protein C7120_03495 [Prevotella sp. oral taxon 376]